MEAMESPIFFCTGKVNKCPTGWNFTAMGFNVLLPMIFLLFAMRKEHPFRVLSQSWLKDVKDLLAIHLHLRESDELTQHFWQEYAAIRQRFGEMAMSLIMCLHAIVTVLLACQTLAGVTVYSRFWLSAWSCMGFLIMLMVRFPNLHNWRGLPVSYILASLSLCAYILPVDGMTKQQILLSNAPLMMGFVMIAPLGGVIGSMMAICVYSAVAMYSFVHAAGASDIEPALYIWWQCSIGSGVTLLGACCSILYVSNMVLVGIRRKAEAAEHAAVFSLLSLVCDAVVEVDTHGAIMSQADRLYNILLMNASATASCSFRQGTQLQSFLFSDADRQIFEDLMQQAAATKNAEVRHMGMRDSMGSLVKMEVFLLSFEKGGSSRYLLGIREHPDYECEASGSGIRVLCDDSQESKERMSLTGINEHGDYEPDMPEMLSKERATGGFHMFPTSSGARADEASSEHSDVSEQSHRSRAEERFLAGMMPTNSRAVDVSLITVMSSWRLFTRGRRPTCCAFHEATRELKQACRRFHTRPCLSVFRQETGYQCPLCGIEDASDPNGECMICARIELLYPPLRENHRGKRRAPRHRGRDPQLSGGGESDANRLALETGAHRQAERRRSPSQLPELPEGPEGDVADVLEVRRVQRTSRSLSQLPELPEGPEGDVADVLEVRRVQRTSVNQMAL